MARIRHTWAAHIRVSVDAPSECIAYAKFFFVVCERLHYPQGDKSLGVIIRWPFPLQPSFLYRNYQIGKRLQHKQMYPPDDKWSPARLLSREEIDSIEKSGSLSSYDVRMSLRYSLSTPTTWEDSTRWLSDLFTPSVTPGMRFLSAEEDTLTNWGG